MARRSKSIVATSTSRTRKRMSSPYSPPLHVKALSPTHLPISPASPRVPVELVSDDEGQLILPIRFQCPLCFDVLRAPIQLPCCARHLCQECFERALELTSANCGFCRKRIVGMVRKKQYHVDEPLWSEIRRCCPFVAHTSGTSDCVVDIEFVDENAPPKGPTIDVTVVREPEATKPTVDVSSPTPTRRPVSADPKTKMQRRLDAFFAGTLPSPIAPSRPTSAGSVRSLRSTTSSRSSSSSSTNGKATRATPRGRRLDVVGKKSALEKATKSLGRSASHSPKRRTPVAVQRTLLQLTLHSPTNSGVTTRQATASQAKNSHVVTRPRRPWLCRHCTFENNCFATRCSMCQHYPASTLS